MYRLSPALRTFPLVPVLALAACGDNGTTTTQATATISSTGVGTSDGTSAGTSTTSEAPTTGTPTTGTGSATGSTTDVTGTTGTTAVSATDVTTDGPLTSTTDTTSTGSSSTSESSSSGSSSSTTGPDICFDGEIICEANTAKTCDGMGGFTDEENCDPGVCVPGVGCLVCNPGDAKCNGENSEICNNEGTGWDVVPCDGVQGVMCDANSGYCVGACSPSELGLSYIGCEYFPTVTNNVASNVQPFNFAVAVANASNNTANVRIDRGANIVVQTTVAAGAVKVINLPWVTQLLGQQNSSSMLVADGAYRLRTDQPVTVYQYDPVEYGNGFAFTYTNDASLLLPVNTWTGDYWVVSRNMWNYFGSQYPGFYAVTAAHDNTQVTLAPSATGNLVRAGGGVAANGTGVITMNQGDVLQVFVNTNTPNAAPDTHDLTGTHVTADKPIQVIGGHHCTFIPHNVGYCDHLEESIPPYETLAREIIVAPPLIPTGGNTPKAQMVRIVATEPNTTLEYDPPQPGAPTMIASAGQYVELAQTAQNFKLTSNNKIVVAQYMLGQDAGGNSGDPAMLYAVPTEQYRTSYLFHAPINYEKNYVNIVAPMGASVTLDGNAVANFTAIGASGFGVARVALPNNVDGNHEISADQKIGISVYGYGQYTSYWYPGGLDLKLVPM